MARDLRVRGHRVVGIDVSSTLIHHAQEADPEGHYVRADAMWLPFPDGTFDTAVAYNSLMDVDDMSAAVREAARVLVSGGTLAVSVTHPITDAGSFQGSDPGSPFVIPGNYLGRRRYEGTFERDGLVMTFRGWCYPLEDYSRALEDAGFRIERLREPTASDEAVEAFGPDEERWRRVPLFLQIRAVKG